jgi:hypothetical protein
MTTRFVVFSAAALLTAAAAAQAGPAESLAFAIGQCSSQPDEKARLTCYDLIAAQLRSGSFLSSAPQVSQQSQSTPPFVNVPTPGSQAAQQPFVPRSAPVAQAPVAPAVIPQPPVSQQQAAQVPPPRRDSSSWYDPTSWFGSDDEDRAQTGNPAEFGAETVRAQQPAAGEPERPAPIDHIKAGVATVAFNPNGRFTVTLDNGQVWKQLEGDSGIARFKNKGHDVVTISRGILGSYNLVLEGQTALFKVKRVR